MRTSSPVALLLAGCATNGLAGPDAIPVEPGSVRLELVRYAGRMTAHAWVDDRQHGTVMRMRLDRETFTLPVDYDLGRKRLAELGPGTDPAALVAEIDADYERAVVGAFERFWKTGPFTTPGTIDRVAVLDDRLRSEGVHVLHIGIEPDTVSWSVTFRVVRERSAGGAPELLATLDLDSMMVPPIDARRYPLPSVRFVRGTPDRAIARNRPKEPA